VGALQAFSDFAAAAGRAKLTPCPERNVERKAASLHRADAHLLILGDAPAPRPPYPALRPL